MLAAALVGHIWSPSVGGVVQGEIGGQSGMHKLRTEPAVILLLYTVLGDCSRSN